MELPRVTFETAKGRLVEYSEDLSKSGFCMATVPDAHLANYFVPFLPRKRLDAHRLLEDIGGRRMAGETAGQDVERLLAATEKILKPGATGSRFTLRPAEFLQELEQEYPDWRMVFTDSGAPDTDPSASLGPLHRLKDWQEYYRRQGKRSQKRFSVMVNANWFYVRKNKSLSGFPYLFPLTYVQGLAVSSPSSRSERKDARYSVAEVLADYVSPADALVVFKRDSGKQRLQIIKFEELRSLELAQVEFAVSGFKIIERGQFLANRGGAANKAGPMGRTIVGINEDGTVLKLIVFTSSTFEGLPEKLKGKGLHEAINLDNSGSSQMLTPFGVFYAAEGKRPWDSSTPMGRPIPCFFGVLET